jgi:2-keto-4-pentenoate hydratase/2-oxohepta-3-ene-1,7-dioic acid hydratase in catechol pathway
MRLAAYDHQGRATVGLVSDDGASVRPLPLTSTQAARGVLAFIESTDVQRKAWLADAGASTPLPREALLSPVPRPNRNVFCVGRNYREHAKELSTSVFKDNNADVKAWPIVFTKVPECVTGPYAQVQLPDTAITTQIDYEAELAVVIGKGGKNISAAEAMSHVFGYTVVNDVTARDVQMRHAQWDLGKSFDTFCPMGPWIVTADEFDGTKTRVRCWVNGELRQDGVTTDLIFDLPTLIETCSRGITLYPGDIIATGTPAGVGMGMNPPRYLAAGDKVKIEIVGLGVIENEFVASK